MSAIGVNQLWANKTLHALSKGDDEVIVTIGSPPSPLPNVINRASPTPLGEEMEEDPSGLPDVVDSGYEPPVSQTFAEFEVQERLLESNTNLFNQIVARWSKETAMYPTKNGCKWT